MDRSLLPVLPSGLFIFASLAWGTKATAILITGSFAWEGHAIATGLALAGAGTWAFARGIAPTSSRGAAHIAALLAGTLGMVALVAEVLPALVPPVAAGFAYAVATIALLVGFVMTGRLARDTPWGRTMIAIAPAVSSKYRVSRSAA